MLVDQSTDIDGRLAHSLARMVTVPDFVKTASNEALRGGSDLPIDCYADMTRRLFPTHTAAATWASAAHFLEQAGNYHDKEGALVERRLAGAAAFHGMTKAFKQLQEKFAARDAMPAVDLLTDEDFALVLDGERHFPMRNPLEVKAAADYHSKLRDANAPLSLRREYASRVLEKAAHFGAKLTNEDELTRTAGHGACSATTAAEVLLNRVKVARGRGGIDDPQAELLKLARVIATKPSQVRSTGVMLKVADTLDQFDRTYHLTRHYGEGFPRPEDAFFAVTKEAMTSLVRDNVETASGSLYKLADLERLRVRDLRDAMGDEFADAVTADGLHFNSEKAGSVVSKLSRPDAELFDVLCRENGVVAWARTGKSDTVELPREYLQMLAAR